MRAWAWAISSLLLLAACGSERARGGDGGVTVDGGGPGPDAGVVEGIEPPAAPMPPASPTALDLSPCRPGWETVETDVATVCAPGPDPAPDCGDAEALFVGETACRTPGSPCPDGEWPAELPAEGVLFVDDDAAEGGTGQREMPFATIEEATDRARPGEVVAVAKGRYDAVFLPEGVTLRGACAAETVITASRPSEVVSVVSANGPGGRVQDVTLTGPRPGVWAGTGASLTLEGVVIRDVVLVGIEAYGAQITLHDVIIRGVAEGSMAAAARALTVEEGTTARLARVVLEGAGEVSLYAVDEGTEVSLEDVAVRETRKLGEFGEGITVGHGAFLEANGLVVERSEGHGVIVIHPRTRMVANDTVLRDNAGDGLQVVVDGRLEGARVQLDGNETGAVLGANGTVIVDGVTARGNRGRGFAVQDGSRAELRRAWLSANGTTAILVSNPPEGGTEPASLLLEDALVQANDGPAIHTQFAGQTVARRGRFTDNAGTTFVALHEGTTVALEDVFAARTRREGDVHGRMMEVRLGASANLARVDFEEGREIGLFLEEGSRVVAEDLRVAHTAPRDADGWAGRGIEVQTGSTLTLTRAVLEHNRELGLFCGVGSLCELADVVVRDTTGRASDGLFGRGLGANHGGRITGARVRLVRNRELGLWAYDRGTEVVLSDVDVVDSLPRDCVDEACEGAGGGIGVGAYAGAHVDLEGFAIRRSALCGLQLRDAAADLHGGRIALNPVGVNLQGEGFDFARLMEDVTFEDNDRNVDATALPVPAGVDPLEE